MRDEPEPEEPKAPRLPAWNTQGAEQLTESVKAALAKRAYLTKATDTNTFRLIQGNQEGLYGLILEALGPVLLIQTLTEVTARSVGKLAEILRELVPAAAAIYWKRLSQQEKAPPTLIWGREITPPLRVRELGTVYELELAAGYSQGLFLDQRENRARVRDQAAGKRVLNTFAYTCAFSVVAALGKAAEVVSVDLSRPALDWGVRNFVHNGLDPELREYQFLSGDTFVWFERFAKKERQFDLIILDPPTFSRTKQGRVFRVERDYPELVQRAAELLPPRAGRLLCCTNQLSLSPTKFKALITEGLRNADRADLVKTIHACELPPDFAGDEGMKNVWVG